MLSFCLHLLLIPCDPCSPLISSLHHPIITFVPFIHSLFTPPTPHPLPHHSAECPAGEQWKRTVSEEVPLCERSCQDIYSPPVNCSHSAEGCVCQEGLYRNTEGACIIPALCPCHDQGVLREVRTMLAHTQSKQISADWLGTFAPIVTFVVLARCLRSPPFIPVMLFTHKEGPIRRWVTCPAGHITPQYCSGPQPHQLCKGCRRMPVLAPQLGKPARNYWWWRGYYGIIRINQTLTSGQTPSAPHPTPSLFFFRPFSLILPLFHFFILSYSCFDFHYSHVCLLHRSCVPSLPPFSLSHLH